MPPEVAADGRIAVFTHHCQACDSPWSSTHRAEPTCIFCGAAMGDPEPAPSKREQAHRPSRARAVKTDAPAKAKGGGRSSRRAPATSDGQQAFRDRVDRIGRG